jgi:predicted RNA-binding Zn-ribbon protein involved in translation (DUF1610 family)
LIAIFQKLKQPGWLFITKTEELRSVFIKQVMGDYLKCFRCDNCGAKFIVNKKPKNILNSNYKCPVCDLYMGIKVDDSFLKAMVSKKQLEAIDLPPQIETDKIAEGELKVTS